jgi:hypothetical protein
MLREKLSALSLSCTARKAGDSQSIENPARRIRLAPVLHAPSRDIEIPPSVTTRRSRSGVRITGA